MRRLMFFLYNRFAAFKRVWKLFLLKSFFQNKLNLGGHLFIEPCLSVNGDQSNFFISIGDGCRFRKNISIRAGNNGRLIIGERNFFNNNCSINCLQQIEIGRDNQFGEGVLFYDHNHKFDRSDIRISDQGFNLGHISIGNNCWVGSNVVILKSVVIGNNVVIGAGCIIYKSIPDNTVVINNQQLEYRDFKSA